MFRNLLNPENGLMITMSWITDCIILSLLWVLGCFPIVTIGASSAALYDATFRALRRGDKHSLSRFWQTFRQNWKCGILPTLIFLAAFYVLGKGMIAAWNAAVLGTIGWAFFSGVAFLGVVAVGILSVMFPMLSRFENSLGALVKNTVLLALANLPRTLCLGLINTCVILLCTLYIVPLFFLPSPAALLGSLFLEPMFAPYMTESEDAAA